MTKSILIMASDVHRARGTQGLQDASSHGEDGGRSDKVGCGQEGLLDHLTLYVCGRAHVALVCHGPHGGFLVALEVVSMLLGDYVVVLAVLGPLHTCGVNALTTRMGSWGEEKLASKCPCVRLPCHVVVLGLHGRHFMQPQMICGMECEGYLRGKPPWRGATPSQPMAATRGGGAPSASLVPRCQE
jgi:hypothetical protein